MISTISPENTESVSTERKHSDTLLRFLEGDTQITPQVVSEVLTYLDTSKHPLSIFQHVVSEKAIQGTLKVDHATLERLSFWHLIGKVNQCVATALESAAVHTGKKLIK